MTDPVSDTPGERAKALADKIDHETTCTHVVPHGFRDRVAHIIDEALAAERADAKGSVDMTDIARQALEGIKALEYRAGVLAEREACAKMCEAMCAANPASRRPCLNCLPCSIADAIRARGTA